MVVKVHRNHKAYYGPGVGGGGDGDVEKDGDYKIYTLTYRCTLATRMTPALRWAAMRAILMSH